MSCSNEAAALETKKQMPPAPRPPPLPLFGCPVSFLVRGQSIKIETVMDIDKIIEDTCLRFSSLFTAIKDDSTIALLSLYNHCEPVIQSGPTCGLVALIMCLKLIDAQVKLDLSTVLDQAQSYGITKLGEMFSAQKMSEFIRHQFSVKTELKRDLQHSVLDIAKHLCQGLPVLVPYDADSNYEPCLKDGARAHWAVLIGFCIVDPLDKDSIDKNKFHFKKIVDLNDRMALGHISKEKHGWQKTFNFIKRYLSMERFFVYARQGKSCLIQVWNYQKLCLSNQNLHKVSNKILNDPERSSMIFPKDGILNESLSNQFILLYR